MAKTDIKVPEGKWYQEATINDGVMPSIRQTDTSEKRWNTFIKPLLPFIGEERLFVELGCNAGFYLRKMTDLGFRSIGVERDPTYISHAYYWEECEPKGVKIINADLTRYDLPTSSLVLLANVHYWLKPEDLTKLVYKLYDAALYVVVVGRNNTNAAHKSPSDYQSLKTQFGKFAEENVINGKKHYSVLFKNPSLCEVDTEGFLALQQCSRSRMFMPSFTKFIETVLSGDDFDPLDTDYYRYLKSRRKTKDIYRHIDLIKSIEKDGILVPLVINGEVILDGDHRLIIAHYLGIKRIICKQSSTLQIIH